MKKFSSSFSIITALFLSACGGGGGGSTSNTSDSTPPVSQTCSNGASDYPVCTPPLQTSVPTPTYGASSQELIAFNEINSYRKSIGLGLVAQNSVLDKTAQNHANYIVVNQNFGHIEEAGKTGFTGAYPSDRGQSAGYGMMVGEVIGVQSGITAIRSMINTLYHRDGIFSQSSIDVGMSFNGNWVQPLVVNFGQTQTKYQKNPDGFVTSYPADLQIDVPLVMYPETPNPFPDLSLTNSDYPTKTSSPVSIYARQGTVIKVTSFTVSDGESVLPMRLLTSDNDLQKMIQPNTAHLVGYQPFKANTKYMVQFTGTVNGSALSKSWSFTTGTSLNLGGGAKK